MRTLLISLLVATTTLAVPVSDSVWDEFKLKYRKFYIDRHNVFRKATFEKSMDTIGECNDRNQKGEISFTCKVNKYADEPRDETSSQLLGFKPPSSKETDDFLKQVDPDKTHLRGRKPPPFKNWAFDNATLEIQDQGTCGSCYAFATVAAIESHNQITNGELVKLSEQQIVDCTSDYGNYGCSGGLMTCSYDYFIEKGHGSMLDQHYQYRSMESDKCYYEKDLPTVRLQRYRALPPGNEDLIKAAVGVHGPVAVALDASQPSFLFYKDGIYDDPKCNSSVDAMNHAVVIVGYGRQNEKEYWIIRNTWSKDWGMDGYGLLRKDENTCGIANMASYPVIKKQKANKKAKLN